MVVLIKKKRNSVKDKRYIKIQGKYTKRFLHSKKKPGKQIYMQRGGSLLEYIKGIIPELRPSTAKECATRMAVITVITLMFGPFCMRNVREVISVLWSHIGLGPAMYVQYVATVDYFQGMFAIGMDFSQYIPEMARVFGGAMGNAVFTTVKYIAETLWIYKSYLTQYRAISAILDVCTTATITPIMDFMLKQIADIFNTINAIKTAVGETAGTFAFIYAKIIEIKNHIVVNVIKPLFTKLGIQVDTAGGDLIKGLDRWGGKIGMSIERFTLFYLKIGESNTVASMYDTVDYMKKQSIHASDWVSYLLTAPLYMIYNNLMAMDEKAIYSEAEEARNTEIFKDNVLHRAAAELHQALLAKDAAEARKHLKAVYILEALDRARIARAEADQAARAAADERAREAHKTAIEANKIAEKLAGPLISFLHSQTAPTEEEFELLVDVRTDVNEEAYSTAATGMLKASLVDPADEIKKHITNFEEIKMDSVDECTKAQLKNALLSLNKEREKQQFTFHEKQKIEAIEAIEYKQGLTTLQTKIETLSNKNTDLEPNIKQIGSLREGNDIEDLKTVVENISFKQRMSNDEFLETYKKFYNSVSKEVAIELLKKGFQHKSRCTMSEPPPVQKSPSPILMKTYASVAATHPRDPRAPRAMSLQPIPNKVGSRLTQLSRTNKNSGKNSGTKLPAAAAAALGLTRISEEIPTTEGGTRKRMRYGKRKTQRRQRQRRRHH